MQYIVVNQVMLPLESLKKIRQILCYYQETHSNTANNATQAPAYIARVTHHHLVFEEHYHHRPYSPCVVNMHL